jgi:hypothetical protein
LLGTAYTMEGGIMGDLADRGAGGSSRLHAERAVELAL